MINIHSETTSAAHFFFFLKGHHLMEMSMCLDERRSAGAHAQYVPRPVLPALQYYSGRGKSNVSIKGIISPDCLSF
jgi:hypothetical protein